MHLLGVIPDIKATRWRFRPQQGHRMRLNYGAKALHGWQDRLLRVLPCFHALKVSTNAPKYRKIFDSINAKNKLVCTPYQKKVLKQSKWHAVLFIDYSLIRKASYVCSDKRTNTILFLLSPSKPFNSETQSFFIYSEKIFVKKLCIWT